MTKTLRTVHSSYVDLDPTEYTFAGAFDAYPDGPVYMVAPGAPGPWHVYDDSRPDTDLEWPGTNPLNAQDSFYKHLLKTSPTSAWNGEHEADGYSRCDHCGAWLRYVVVWRHTPTDSYMATGEVCAHERFGHSTKVAKEVDRLRKRAAAHRVSKKQQAAVEAWFNENPDNRFAVEYAEANRDENSFYDDLLRKLKKWGPWTDRQRDAVLRGVVYDRERATRQAERDAEPKVPVPEGRYTVTGEVVSTKWKDDAYGGRLVWTVKDDRGFRVWGTVPTLNVEVPGPLADPETGETPLTRWTVYRPERGDRVRFDAAVTQSSDDPTFGFYKRPTKASVLDVATDEGVAA